MQLYAGTSLDFISDATRNGIASKLERAFLDAFHYKPSSQEVQSCWNSLFRMAFALREGNYVWNCHRRLASSAAQWLGERRTDEGEARTIGRQVATTTASAEPRKLRGSRTAPDSRPWLSAARPRSPCTVQARGLPACATRLGIFGPRPPPAREQRWRRRCSRRKCKAP